MRILVSGMVAGVPRHGGATWAVLQYVLGFARLGHEVVLIEPVEAARPETVAYFRDVVDVFSLDGRAALLISGTHETVGVPYEQLIALARDADLLVNVSGMLRDSRLIEAVEARVYLDLDPAFNQLWHTQGTDVGFEGHTSYVTVGQALGRQGCPVPGCGLDWITTVQPVVLECWPVANGLDYKGLTTVANWRGYGSIEHDGVHYGQKAHSFRRFFELPRRTAVPVFAGLAIHPDERDDLAALRKNGWRLLDATEVAGTPDRYRRFVRSSWAELGIAKSGYVAAHSGWFSDRSVCYLASGRPVLAQETGFSDFLPTGEGLIPFATVDAVVAGVEELQRDYERHRRAARALAEEVFDSDLVLSRLLDAVGAA
jgi:hypothetical protein